MWAIQPRPVDWDEVNSKLKEKGALLPCPRCGKSQFHYAGESEMPLSTPANRTNALFQTIPAPSSIPIIIISCDNCGYLIQHAIGTLLS